MTNENLPTDLIGGEGAVNASMAAVGAADGNGENHPLQSYLVDMTAEIAKPNFRLNIAGVDMLAASDLCVVCGAPKQGKTQFLVTIASVLLSGRSFGSMSSRSTATKFLWIDTEQSKYYIQQNMRRLLSLCKQAPNANLCEMGLPVYSLRSIVSPEKRLEKINEAIALHEPDVLFIDQVRDLMLNFNDEAESLRVASWLLQVLDSRPYLTIVTVLHTNWGTDKLRGHLGSELHTKISEKFYCKKENGVFCVTHEGRGKELQNAFTFKIDEAGELVTCGADAAAGVFNPSDALVAAIGEGCNWDRLVDNYRKFAKVSERQARNIIKDKFNRGEIVSAGGVPVTYVLNPDFHPEI